MSKKIEHMGNNNSDSDVRLMRRLKRRRLDIVPFEIPDNASNGFLRNHQISNEKIDIDYKKYLCGLEESGIWREPVTSGNSNGNELVEEDEEDPKYKSFLDSLKGDGSFYALQVDDSRPLLLKYHGEFSDDELEFPSTTPLRKVPEKEQVDYKRNLRSNMNKDKREIQKSTKTALAKDKGEKGKSKKNVLIKDRDKIPRSTTNVLSKGMPGSLKNTDKVTQKGPHGLGKKHDGYFQKSAPHGNHRLAECGYEQAEIGEMHCQTRPNDFKHQVQGGQIDECYKTFLSSLVTEGDYLVFRTNDGIRVRYEEDDVDSSSDSEVLVATNAADLCKGTHNPFETSRLPRLLEEDGKQCLVDSSRSNYSNFRKTLIEKLRQPYDQVEHDRLWDTLNDRKSKSRHIDLRGRGSAKTFATDECNQSLLKTYSTLKSKIDAVKSNRYKVLNLMRGFFFWLENLAHGDQFQPWKDEICLAVMPGSS